jgi:SpoVK/Ycf46/Vps4 family AAA+-type ATPase
MDWEFFKNVHAAKDKNFGNAREVRNIMQAALQRQSSRVARILKENPTAPIDPMILIREDIEPKGEKAVNMDDIFKKLDSLIGLNDIKKELRSLASYLQVEKKRVELGGRESSLDLHFIFTGNPGTGKTTVARIVADIFKAIGLLPKGQLIEVDRSKLVMGFVGQTATQTDKVVNSALGGILFIDEAYSLASGGEGDFGSEAINTLIKRLEDDKGGLYVSQPATQRKCATSFR